MPPGQAVNPIAGHLGNADQDKHPTGLLPEGVVAKPAIGLQRNVSYDHQTQRMLSEWRTLHQILNQTQQSDLGQADMIGQGKHPIDHHQHDKLRAPPAPIQRQRINRQRQGQQESHQHQPAIVAPGQINHWPRPRPLQAEAPGRVARRRCARTRRQQRPTAGVGCGQGAP